MRETSKLPTEAIRAPSHRPSFHRRSQRTHPRHSPAVRGAPTHVIPLPFAAHPPTPFLCRSRRTHPRHSREGGNPPRCVHTPEETAPPAVYKILQNPTEIRVCARAHARSVPYRHSHLPRHSHEGRRTHLPRHSHEGRHPHPPTSFPRRQAHPPPTSFPRRQAHLPPPSFSPSHVIPAKAGIPSSLHGSPPGRSGLEVSYEVAVP